MPIWTSLVTLLICAYYLWVGLLVGKTHQQVKIPAPAMSGAPLLERAYRVQANAVEFAPLLFPSLWLAAFWTSDVFAAVFGLMWIVGRILYARGYMEEASKRGPGFGVQATAVAVLWLMALGGIIAKLVHG